MDRAIQLDDRLSISHHSVWCDLVAEVVILHVDSGVYFGFDSVGSAIWHFLGDPRTPSEIVAYLMQRYDVGQATCEIQTLQFLEDLTRHGLILVEQHVAA
jgi:hypothetical protein